MKTSTLIKKIPLAGTDNGMITVARLEEPYGEGSRPVASVGVWLSKTSEEPDWKVHIPFENLDEVIEALKKAQEA
jgi:hypothetical protein